MQKKKLALLALASCTYMGLANAQEGAFSPYVDDQGNISRPTDFKTNPNWVHLGAWGIVNENGEGNGIHNVYTTRDAVTYYRANGSFPDGATLVKEVRGAQAAALTTGRAHWATDIAVWFVSVKDTKGRFKNNALWGDGWGWALFQADDPAKQVAADYKADCLSCHVPVKDNDWMYTYAYSAVLGPQAALSAPSKEAALAAPEPSTMTANAEEVIEEVKEEVSPPPAPAPVAAAAQAAAPVAEAAPAAPAATPAPTMGVAAASVEEPSIDLAAAEKDYKSTCAVCHSVTPGRNGIGPSLANIIGNKAGSVEGFNYSDAMKNSEVVWNANTLDEHLKNTRTFIPNNRMASLFPSGVQDDEKRKRIIAYIESLSSE